MPVPPSEGKDDRAARRWWRRHTRGWSDLWSSIAGRLTLFAALALVAALSVSASSTLLADRTARNLRVVLPDAAAAYATTVKLHMRLDRERQVINGLTEPSDPESMVRAGRAVAAAVTGMRDCLAGKEGCVPPPHPLAGMIAAQFGAVQAAGAAAVRMVGRHDGRVRVAIARFNAAVDAMHGGLGRWQDERFALLLGQLTVLIAGTSRVALHVLAGMVGLLVVGLLGLLAVHRMLSRLRQLTRVMLRLARGETSHDVPFRDVGGEIGRMAQALDVFLATARRLAAREADLRLVNGRLDAALNNMFQGVCMYDADNRLAVCNARGREIVGLAADARVQGLTCFEFVDLAVTQGNLSRENADGIKERLRTNLARRVPVNFVQELADGRSLSQWITPMPDGGWVSTFEDITERRDAEVRLRHMAHHDALTGLANRVLFRTELQKVAAAAGHGAAAAILGIDLDHFKEVNDTLGHPVGDALLLAVTARLHGAVRETDLVARLGGDEFAIIQRDAVQPDAATRLAERVVAVLAEPFDLGGHRVTVGGSVGIAQAPTDGTDPDELMRKADQALYQAKDDGRGTYRLFEPGMRVRVPSDGGIEAALRGALAHGEFELHYQEQTDLAAREIIGFEALLRWHAPGRGLVPPAEFIPAAEASGAVVPIGEWVLRQACADAAGWPDHLSVAVNLSAVQFRADGLVQAVKAALDKSGLVPHRLELEITESAMMVQSAKVLQTLHGLRALGVRIAMDDFGTGYSSLSYLQRFPFDKIKIDRSFVSGLGVRKAAKRSSAPWSAWAAALVLKPSPKGSRPRPSTSLVRAEGCRQGQGYLFSRPLPAADLPALLRQATGRVGGKNALLSVPGSDTGGCAAGPTLRPGYRTASSACFRSARMSSDCSIPTDSLT